MKTYGKKTVPHAWIVLAVWLTIVALAVVFTLTGSFSAPHPQASVMDHAAKLAERAMRAVKQYKTEHSIALSPDDKLQTGMIGSGEYTSITTTDGVLESKRTSCNPNWAAVIVGFFAKAGLKKGDQAVLIFSGSFPAMNLCAMAAAEAYGLDFRVMAGIGASYYGANDPNFTFFDMAEYLYSAGVLHHRVDLVSLGGNDDVGTDFSNEAEKTAILERIRASGVQFLYEEDFRTNIDLRLEYLQKELPRLGFVLNVGGSMVGLGTGWDSFLESGYFSPPLYTTVSVAGRNPSYGLLQCGRLMHLPVASLLNLQRLAERYGLPYDPDTAPVAGTESGYACYRHTTYPIGYAVAALVLSAALAALFVWLKKHRAVPIAATERNYIGRDEVFAPPPKK